MGRYKFSLTPQIKGYIEWQIEHYHEDKKQLEQYKNDMIPSATQTYSLTAGIQSGGTSNSTEKIGLKIATNPYVLTTERNIAAIEKVLDKCEPADIKLLDLVYWRRTHTVEGASMKLNYSMRTGYRHLNNILCHVALEMGLINI